MGRTVIARDTIKVSEDKNVVVSTVEFMGDIETMVFYSDEAGNITGDKLYEKAYYDEDEAEEAHDKLVRAIDEKGLLALK